jgi:heptosyltransferase-1
MLHFYNSTDTNNMTKNIPTIKLPDNPRILIIRLSAIGDVLMTSPVPKALKENIPGAHITWIVDPLSTTIVQHNPYVDDVIVVQQLPKWQKMFDKMEFIPLLREFSAFGKELRKMNFDVALDCQGLLKSGLIANMTGAPIRVSINANEWGNQYLVTRVVGKIAARRLSTNYTHILSAFGFDDSPRDLVLDIPDETLQEARKILTDHGLNKGKYAAFCVSSSRPQKDWVWNRWGDLADLLWRKYEMKSVIIAGPERRIDAMRLQEEHTESRPVPAAGLLSLIQSAAIVQGADVIIGVDTGLTYAGLSANKPTVALYGSTTAEWLAEEPTCTVCLHPYPCAPCKRHPICKNFDCMFDITIEEVDDSIIKIMAEVEKRFSGENAQP